MDTKKKMVTGRVRAMRINNVVLPQYREFCRRNFEWMGGKFPIHDPCENMSDELWLRRSLKFFREEENCVDGFYPITTWLVFIDNYVMGVVRIASIVYDIDDCQDNLTSHVDFCVDEKFRGGNASAAICELAINLAFSATMEGEEVVVTYPEDHKAMPKVLETVFRNNKFFEGKHIKGQDEDGNNVVGYRIAKRSGAYNPPYRRINVEEAKEVFGCVRKK